LYYSFCVFLAGCHLFQVVRDLYEVVIRIPDVCRQNLSGALCRTVDNPDLASFKVFNRFSQGVPDGKTEVSTTGLNMTGFRLEFIALLMQIKLLIAKA